MPNPAGEPTFLPLTMAAAEGAEGAHAVRDRARAADRAAADCWLSLVAGCASGGQALVGRLHDLSEATSGYAGTRWWHGSVHRRRVVEAESRIDDAVREGDGAEFAEAFAGYDQAVATVVVHVQNRLGKLSR
ncbi:sugar ABC transporter substrate-binding protein [Saccharothrix obliqua]|uniref:sugar ABC transporter substrate-binding protein n=1 Tax=Saccharothrix obliqua TaxID=2861747 RepID=UPI001C601599|nr:sugar ABC transporter substrate-binding protein [Saccharothrix obliqua]MBW4719217.1 sugar ABC transporter substrate-binding protein [Saccharothrix obliqua]